MLDRQEDPRDPLTVVVSNPILDDDDPTLFPKLTDAQVELLARQGRIRPIQVGDVLFRPGDVTYDAMVLLKGLVAVVIGSGETERDLCIQRPRDLMVEFNILTGEPVGATGVVREAGSLLAIPAVEFRAMLGRELIFGDFVLQMLFRRRRAIERLQLGIQVVGSRFDRDTQRLREFASRNRLLHDWLDAEDPRANMLFKKLGIEGSHGPIVVVKSGKWLRNPTNAELATAIGLEESHVPIEKSYDLIVIGAGPGGLAAGVYAGAGGLRTVIVEAEAVGGQAATSARIENYLGFPAGLSGSDLAERARLQAIKFGAHIMVPRRAIGLTEREGYHVVTLEGNEELFAASVILALGVQYRRLPIPRLAEYEGIGVAYAVESAREQLRENDAVVVVGGANSAGQAALALAEDRRKVHLVVRGDSLERSMARYLRDRIAANGLDVLFAHEVHQLAGNTHLEQVIVQNISTGEQRTIDAGALLVLIGAAPRTDWLAGAIALDAEGYVLTGPSLPVAVSHQEPWAHLERAPFLVETSRPGVFAVGDVRSGSTRMVASAVGEGGMAVRFVSEYLAHTTRATVRDATTSSPP
jgi:thioredoxin reductase (NADPH)